MKNNKLHIILLIVTIAAFMSGFSYAYFSTVVLGNDAASSHLSKLGTLQLTYNGNDYIDLTSAIPGDKDSMQFIITNTGTLPVSNYEVNLSRVINSFSNNEIIYDIECESSDELSCNGKTASPFPKASQTVIVQTAIASGTTHTYTLNVEFIDTGLVQDYNRGSKLNFKIEINELLQLDFLVASLDNMTNYNGEPSGGGGGSNAFNKTDEYITANLFNVDKSDNNIKPLASSNPYPNISFDERFFWGYRFNITSITFENTINIPAEAFEYWDVSESQNGNIMAYIIENEEGYEEETFYDLYIQSNGTIYANTNSSSLFNFFVSLYEINNIELLNTKYVTDMSFMFNNTGLQELDLSSFDTSNVTNMRWMFGGNNNLKVINLSSFDTSLVNNMSNMFMDCDDLVTLDLSSFSADSLITAQEMFMGCVDLVTLDLSNFNLVSDVNILAMFRGTESLSTLYLDSAILGDNQEYNNNCLFIYSNINMTIVVDDPTSYTWIINKLQNSEYDICNCFPDEDYCGGGGVEPK